MKVYFKAAVVCWESVRGFVLSVLFTGSSFKVPQMAAFTERLFIAFFQAP